MKSQNWAGETVGIMVLDCQYPFVSENVANPTTFDFPVRYCLVKGVTVERLLYQADMSLLEPFIAAACKLQAKGAKTITGTCG